jgi:hypothetical protein
MSKVNESKAAPEGATVLAPAELPPSLALMDTQQRREWAQRYLADPRFNEVLEALKRGAYEAWLNPENSTPEKRERLWAFARGLEKIHTEMIAFVDSGRIDRARMKAIGDGK